MFLTGLLTVAMTLAAIGYGDDERESRAKDKVIYRGQKVVEFSYDAKASEIEIVMQGLCAHYVLAIEGNSGGHSHSRIIATCQ